MFPDSVETFTTPGEQLVFNFLETAARPDSKNLVWYSPDVEDREPDFILFNDEQGLMIFEVKDWSLNQILEANPKTFRLSIGTRTNPLEQAKGYVSKIMSLIEKDGKLYSKSKHNPKFPIGYGVIFPNINKYEYEQRDLNKIINTNKILFSDDMHLQGALIADKSGKKFQTALSPNYKVTFEFHLSPWERCHLKQLLFPEVKISLPEREQNFNYSWHQEQIRILDSQQENLARKIDKGHWILTGPAGCGKTLVLVHKAQFLLKYNPQVYHILIVCYNITLVAYIKRLLANKLIPQGEKGVQVKHIYELAGDVIKDKIKYEKQDGNYYETVLDLALEDALSYPKYDAILVDEGQDFSDPMYKLITSILNPKTDNLTIAMDESQNLYHPVQSWKKLGVRAQGRLKHMPYVYRNTIEISKYATQYASPQLGRTNNAQADLFSDTFEFHGPEPIKKEFADHTPMLGWIGKEITRLVQEESYPLNEIAVLYATQFPDGKEGYNLPQTLLVELEGQGLISQWVTKDASAKRSYDCTTQKITISTVQSVKGLDFACVFLVGLGNIKKNHYWTSDTIRNLMYVGCTRGRYRLFLADVN